MADRTTSFAPEWSEKHGVLLEEAPHDLSCEPVIGELLKHAPRATQDAAWVSLLEELPTPGAICARLQPASSAWRAACALVVAINA